MLHAAPLKSQESDGVKYIAQLLAKDPEELSEEELIHYEELIRRPLSINAASQERMAESSLFTRYQIASLTDYIKRCGQILSFTELCLMDGFNEDFVRKIKPFVSLEHVPELKGRSAHELTSRVTLRNSSGESRYGYAGRYKFKAGERVSASLALSRSLNASRPVPDAVSGSVAVRFRKVPMRLCLGDYNARFGQGLSLWSGTDFSSLNTPSAFMKRPSGIIGSSSFTGSGVMTGAAAEFDLKRFSLAAFASVIGLRTNNIQQECLKISPGFNATWLWKYGQLGATHYNKSSSIDFSACYNGVDLFWEFAYDWAKGRHAALAGVIFPVGDLIDLSAMTKYSAREHMLALGGSLDTRKRLSGSMSANAILYSEPKSSTQDKSLQIKFHTQWQYALGESLVLKLRVTERIRSWGQTFRTDVRTDVSWQAEHLSAVFRFNMLRCVETSFLTYAEGGCKFGNIAVYLRQGAFCVDKWDDRIYAYERDAPGCYNSPAFYGRGVWSSFYASWKASGWCKIYFRAGYTSYPFMEEKKPGKAELRFQTVFSF